MKMKRLNLFGIATIIWAIFVIAVIVSAPGRRPVTNATLYSGPTVKRIARANISSRKHLDEYQPYEEREAEMFAEAERDFASNGEIYYVKLEDVIDHIYDYYTEEEISLATLVTMGEDLVAHSETIWAAHVWSYLNRIGAEGFDHNKDIMDILTSGQYDAYTPENMAVEQDPTVRATVIDVFARKILEDMGYPPEMVGRVLPKQYTFFRYLYIPGDWYNHFYDAWNGGNEYNPFDAPYNPYAT